PVTQLVSAALTADEDARYDYTTVLHLRADQETFDAARKLCHSANPTRRAFGVDILAKLGAHTVATGDKVVEVPAELRRFREPAAALVLDLASREHADEVLRSIGHALGHLANPRAVATLGRLRTHPDVNVRWAVTCSLEKFAGADDTALGFLVE